MHARLFINFSLNLPVDLLLCGVNVVCILGWFIQVPCFDLPEYKKKFIIIIIITSIRLLS
jgi:hypothetical protein